VLKLRGAQVRKDLHDHGLFVAIDDNHALPNFQRRLVSFMRLLGRKAPSDEKMATA
jgi:hypothetical protein